jgi:hypothetical protein
LFFEGEFGELFPRLDDNDSRPFDIGFSVGRQPIRFQEGLLVNDSVDAIGVTRNNLKTRRAVNYLVTFLYGWSDINRNTESTNVLTRNAEADSARLIGLFNEVDLRASTVNLDIVYVSGGKFRGTDVNGVPAEVPGGDGVYLGVSLVQRLRTVNTAFRILKSVSVGQETPEDNVLAIGNPASDGWLALAELSWTPHRTNNLFYSTAFYAENSYRAAALNPDVQGPLERAGILFAGSPVGDPAAISPVANESAGGAFGYQLFSSDSRRQVLIEFAARLSTQDCPDADSVCDPHTVAAGVRYQRAIGRHGVFLVDGYVAEDRMRGLAIGLFGESRRRVGQRVAYISKF